MNQMKFLDLTKNIQYAYFPIRPKRMNYRSATYFYKIFQVCKFEQ